ncbi:MAG: sodium-dependent transporter [Gammaproteobacteria bacterium]|nr:sodium-dependent transporter [Gammaproteobacteria bacterium]MBT8106147.1 sodium-dependent transporter [Gammaproteobacteria bacterium]NNF48575.1 sodium-dependent transporter [Woeseiaceae bacterium]NNK26161.1 sodium-dependent transporter [Woeseiaceae bacterium]NNL63447.1 sodium-dependent transporter [Woeseiaceae bacterium]
MLTQQTDDGKRSSLHGNWSSRMAFILAVTGSAVGLGNIWKFPYIAGQNGGGAFVLVYLACVILIGMPVMMSEILIGRRGRRNPVRTMELLGKEEGGSGRWRWVGGLGVVAGILILSYYSVIAGWTLAYIVKSVSGVFAGASPQAVGAEFDNFVGDWRLVGLTHTVFMGLAVFVVARGVERGLEQAVRFMVPALLVLMLVLLGYSISSGYFGQGVAFMFTPDFGALTRDSILAALGQAFFTLSIGMGAVMAYGAYLPEETSITGASAAVVTADTSIAMLAGLAIFPLVFANGLTPGDGPGLVFNTLPLAFGQMPGGVFFSTVFFVLLSFAAWTSAIGLMEPAVAWIVEHYSKTRAQATVGVGLLIWFIGLGSVLSFNVLADARFLAGTIFDNVDYLTSNVMLPLGGLLIVWFAGWVMSRNSTSDELGGSGALYKLWRFSARYLAPVGILFVLLNAIGLLG